MNPTYPRPPRRRRRRVNRAELEQLRRDVVADSTMTDQLAEQLERRVTALEELVFARWPRSIAVRRRLAQDLRASVAGYGGVGPDFESRRIQAIGDGWVEPLSATPRQPRPAVPTHEGAPSRASLRSTFRRGAGRHQ